MNTKLTKLLGIQHPIICGGMVRIGSGDLPAAVSNAGGLGMIGSGAMTGEELRSEIAYTRSLTDKPFGVNIQLRTPYVEDVLKVVIQEKIAVVTTGNGDPRPIIDPLHKEGVKIIPVVPSLRLAKRLEPLVDALIFEGNEAGGHVGLSTTMALMSMIPREITQIPVIAAGGFASGQGLAAARVMGVDGLQMGTAFLLAEECPVHPNTKQALLKADDTATMITGSTIQNSVRGLRNPFAEDYYQKEISGTSIEDLHKLATGSYTKGMVEGDVEHGSIATGIVVGMLNEIRPAKDIIEEIVRDAKEILQNAPHLL